MSLKQNQVRGCQVVYQIVAQGVVDQFLVKAIGLKFAYDGVQRRVVHRVNLTDRVVLSNRYGILHPRMLPDLLKRNPFCRVLDKNLSGVNRPYLIRSLKLFESFIPSGKPKSDSMMSLCKSGMLFALKGIVPVTMA